MPKLKENQVPAYRLHKQSGQAIVTLSGKDHLLGPHGSKESRVKYDRFIAEWMANGRRADYRQVEGLTVSRIIVEFLAHAKAYYIGPDGKDTGEAENFKLVLAPLRRLYGGTAASEFGPRALKALQQDLVKLGWCRSYLNRQVNRVRHVFRWAVSQELIPATVLHGLEAVEGLRQGKSEAPESEPVKPVPTVWVEATLQHVGRQVKAMAELQMLTGMRPGEVCIMRGADIDTSGEGFDPPAAGPMKIEAPGGTGKVWVYRPQRHKTQHHGHTREIYLGPKAKDIVRRFLKADLTAYLFSPKDTLTELRAERHANRKTPPSCGNGIGTHRTRQPAWIPAEHYTPDSYRQALARGCDEAFPPPAELARDRVRANGRKGKNAKRWETAAEWRTRLGEKKWAELRDWQNEHRWQPNQLRHNAATDLRRQYGIEAARVILGHTTADTTEIYAEADVQKARAIMGEVG